MSPVASCIEHTNLSPQLNVGDVDRRVDETVIARSSNLAHAYQKLLKVIIETCYLSIREIEPVRKLWADAGADFVTTSTEFAPSGAIIEHIALMKKVLPTHVGIKASEGIKTLERAKALIHAGADRIGTSAGISILTATNAKH